jgi:hypothetical protein
MPTDDFSTALDHRVITPEQAQSEFAAIAETFKLRDPSTAVGRMIVGTGKGVCLEPLLPERARIWFDPTVEAQDGDLVLIRYTDQWVQRLFEAAASASPEWRTAWRESDLVDGELPRFACKVLRIVNGAQWVLWKDAAIPLRGKHVVGSVVAVARHAELDGRPFLGCRSRHRRLYFVLAACVAAALIDQLMRFMQ